MYYKKKQKQLFSRINLIPSKMKLLLILVGGSFRYFPANTLLLQGQDRVGCLFSTANVAMIVSGLVVVDNFDKKSDVSLM